MNETTTRLTERGQTSVPAAIRRRAKLKVGQVLRWEFVSAQELRVFIAEPVKTAPSAAQMIGFARRNNPSVPATTAEMLRILRAGEREGEA